VCAEAGGRPEEIYEIVVVGNVTMISLASGSTEPSYGAYRRNTPTIPARAADFGVSCTRARRP